MPARSNGITPSKCYAAAAACVLAIALTAAHAAAASAATWWQPPQHLTWYWQLDGNQIKTEPVMATDFDPDTRGAASIVSTLHADGQHAICYVDVGTAENYRADYKEIPTKDLGKTNGWPGERWLDIRDIAGLEPIMNARFQACAAEGFDAVEPDNMDGYENTTGFPLTAASQLAYNEWVANAVHSLGMAVFQKNDPDQSATLQPYFDGVIDDQCNQYDECSSFDPYLAAGKPVLNAEYKASQMTKACAADNKAGIMGALFNLALNGKTYTPCW
jgi:hypothetical protein